MFSRLTPRERVLKAVRHQEPDRVPLASHGFDRGGGQWGRVDALEHIMSYLGLRSMEEVEERLHIDVRGINVGLEQKDISKINEGHNAWNQGVGSIKDTSELDNLYWPTYDELFELHFEDLFKEIERIRALPEEYAIIAGPGISIYETASSLRGREQFWIDLISNPEIACGIMDRITGVFVDLSRALLTEIGDKIDLVLAGSDDYGMQDRLQFSPDIFRRLIKPRVKRGFEAISKLTTAPRYFHSCGAIYDVIPDLIEIGIQILEPIQVGARGMNIVRLKKEFGDSLCFWGGIDVQKILPFGSQQDVEREVVRTFEILGNGGGYIMSPSHSIAAVIPPQNVLTMYDTGKNKCRYEDAYGGGTQ